MSKTTRKEIAKKIAKTFEEDYKAIEEVIEEFATEVGNELAAGNDVSIPGFGIFKTKISAARTGRNPRTGEAVQIAEKRAMSFKASNALKDRIQQP